MAYYHHIPKLSSCLRRALLLSNVMLLVALLGSSQGQITLDGSLGSRGALRGPHYTISDSVGQLRGANLFHSFGHFNLAQGESATFTGPNTIANILSRVTGGSPSSIDGTIRSPIPGAHLYLLNPSGVLFGPNARLDVRGSFHVSTADYLRLADGARFSARLSETSVLSVAPPVAFGFLSPQPATIALQGSTLHVPEGQTLSVIGGDIEIRGNVSPTAFGGFSFERPTLEAPTGRINLASVAAAGEVGLTTAAQLPALQVHTVERLGSLTIREALLDVSGNGGGTVTIRGGRLLVDRAEVRAHTQGNMPGASPGVDIQVGQLALTGRGELSSATRGSGQGGAVTVTAQESIMITNGGISSGASGDGDAGHVAISAPTIAIQGGGVSAGTSGAGRAGDIVVHAGQLSLDGGGIGASTRGAGRGGDIVVHAGQLSLTRGAQIDSSSDSTGAAGTIQITSTTMDMRGDAFIRSDTFDGPGGTIKITVDTLSMTETTDFHQVGSPAIRVGTQGKGNAGDILIEGRQVALTGNTITIDSSTSGSGRGGTVTIHATDSITLAGRRDMAPSGDFVPSAEGFGNIGSRAGMAARQGDAGMVSIVTPVLTMTGGTLITTRTIGNGNAGDIEITVGRLTLTDGAQISSTSGEVVRPTPDIAILFGGTGKGGAVKVTAADAIFISGRDPTGITISGIASETRGPGQAGRVAVSTPQLVMADGGQITADTVGAGRGGDVVVQVGRLSLAGGAQIRSGSAREETLVDLTLQPIPSQGTGPGGTVMVTATDTVSIAGRSSMGGGVGLFNNDASSGLFSTATGPGAAGEIVVSVPTLMMSDGGKISVRTTGAGRAGDITVQSGNLTLTGGALIDSSTDGAGRGGVVTVTAREALGLAGHGSGLFASTSGQGQGGDLTLQAHQLQLSDGAAIAADSAGTGNAGSVTITASDVVQHTQSSVTTNTRGSGDAGRVSITAATLEVMDGRISAVTSGTGQGGDVVVNVERLILSGQAQIDSSSLGAGQGGSVTVNATDALALSGPGGLLSNAAGSGAAGMVSVRAPVLRMDHAATIEARTTGDGRAGNVEVHVGQSTVLGGAHISSTSGMVDATGTVVAGAGRGGMVTVTATDMSAIAGRDSTGAVASGVFSQTFGPGDAGSVTVRTPHLTLADGGRIGAETGGAGRGGDVAIQGGSLTLTGGAQINSSSGISGSVSKVEMVAPMGLTYKVLFPSISTFETPPSRN